MLGQMGETVSFFFFSLFFAFLGFLIFSHYFSPSFFTIPILTIFSPSRFSLPSLCSTPRTSPPRPLCSAAGALPPRSLSPRRVQQPPQAKNCHPPSPWGSHPPLPPPLPVPANFHSRGLLRAVGGQPPRPSSQGDGGASAVANGSRPPHPSARLLLERNWGGRTTVTPLAAREPPARYRGCTSRAPHLTRPGAPGPVKNFVQPPLKFKTKAK